MSIFETAAFKMQISKFNSVALLFFQYLTLVRSHTYFIPDNILNGLIFPTLNLGNGPRVDPVTKEALKDLLGRPIADQLCERMQYQGAGYAQIIFETLSQMYKITDAMELKEKRVLFVGGLCEKGLAAWTAAAILSSWGVKCELYVIQDEENEPTDIDARKYSIALLNYMRDHRSTFPGLIFVHFKGFESKLEDEFPSLRQLKARLAERDPAKRQAAIDGWNQSEEGKKYQELGSNLTLISLVVEAIPTLRPDFRANEIKIGNIWALKFIQKSENKLISLEVPGTLMLPQIYKEFGLRAFKPISILYFGSIKPYAGSRDAKNIFHHVISPKPLEEVLTTEIVEENFILKFSDKIKNVKQLDALKREMRANFEVKTTIVDISTTMLESAKNEFLSSEFVSLLNYASALSPVPVSEVKFSKAAY